MKATEILMAEHRTIERMLDVLDTAAQRISSGGAVPPDLFLKAVDFIKNYADGCHHNKEEDVLFVALIEHGMSREQGPVAVMLAEHVEGRRLTGAMREAAEQMQAGDQSAASRVTENALGYVKLLRQHIQKEDQILFPMSDRTIPVEQHQAVNADFDEMAKGEAENGLHERYLGLVSDLEKAVFG
ncbi:MAG: hemerythrin domain-containing protein [Anaerolineales bacterium]|nr:hemerythrin domain-containing protein [Anaerolineales bacterium]